MEDFRKFPRTHHLFVVDKGSISRDDLVMDKRDALPFFSANVTVEEKIDGTNLGFSVDPSTYRILVQNRSHFVTSQTHSQFKSLDQWIQEHPMLFEVLYPNYVLFGEWLYAQHTVFYDKLPSTFIAFDIYDKTTKQFLSVDQRNRRLAGTGIEVVRPLATGTFRTKEDYTRLLDLPSHYTTKGPLEGIYLRVDEGDYLKQRAKVVRKDFIQHIESSDHWSKAVLVKNVVDYTIVRSPQQ